jgi:CubicO group peptidase (beta-lactamase class C family)
MSTTLSIMKLVDEGKIDIDQRLKYYFPELDSTNKGDILIRDLLAHQARLTPWIPFYLHSMKDQKLDTALYKNHKEDGYNTMVTPDIYILDSYVDSILGEIKESDLLKKKKYRYSDLGMYYMRRLVEKKSGENIYTFVEDNFYSPLGLKYIGFNPLERFPKEEMAPTEQDTYFRNEIIQGTVHDPGCAMVGGIEGHAGLFSNSLNLAILSQMLLQKGNYCDSNYINSKTILEFTRQQFPLNDNRRGLGFDKSLPNHEEGGPTCPEVSSNSFGHSGFTGTLFWVDPDYGIIYIFLSNRTFPTAENIKLIKMNIRTEIQKEIYNLFGIKVPKMNN